MYKTGMLMDYIHRPVSSIDRDVSESGEVKPSQLGPVERANLVLLDLTE
jgi:hypothetical protein